MVQFYSSKPKLVLITLSSATECSQCPYFWNSQSLLSRGQTCLVFSQREMQWKWKAWLHIPQATVHSSLVALAWLAWHSMHRSMMWFLQMAQLSTTMSQAHRATAFHFFTSNLFLSFPMEGPAVGISLSLSTSILFSRKYLKLSLVEVNQAIL